MPGLGQTPLETSKLASNRDVGLAVLEALSRVLESRVALMAQMIEAVLVRVSPNPTPNPTPTPTPTRTPTLPLPLTLP